MPYETPWETIRGIKKSKAYFFKILETFFPSFETKKIQFANTKIVFNGPYAKDKIVASQDKQLIKKTLFISFFN